MAAGDACSRREGEAAEENETRILEEEAESRMILLSPCVEGTTHRGGIVAMEMEEVEPRRRKKKKKRSCETVKEAELEVFFQAAEKDLRDKMLECSRKYSFDFEKDEPLCGRYEWVKLNP